MANPDLPDAGNRFPQRVHLKGIRVRAGHIGSNTPDSSRAAAPVPPWWFWSTCGLLTAAYLCVALLYIAELPLLDPDEPRYAGAGRAMASGGSLLVPEFNGEARINKPPLFYWLVALSDKLAGGATETSSRAPSIVLGLIMLWGTIWLGRKTFGPMTGLLAGLVLAATPLFMALSRCCITDMTLSTFMAGTLAVLMLGMTGLMPLKKSGWIATLLFGLAVLTKATAAFAVLLAVVIERAMSLPKAQRPAVARILPWALLLAVTLSAGALFCEWRGKGKHGSKRAKAAAIAKVDSEESADEEDAPLKKNSWTVCDGILNKCAIVAALSAVGLLLMMAFRAERLAPALPPAWKWGLLLAIAMGLWWYIMLIANQGWDKFKDLLYFEINQRVAGAVHREGMHYYLMLLPALAFPWSMGLAGTLGTAWPRAESMDEIEPREHIERRAAAFLVAWILGIVFFFSIPGAKLPTYVLPAMPAVAILTARFILKLSEPVVGVDRTWLRATLYVSLFLALVLLLFPIYVRFLQKDIVNFIGDKPAVLWAMAGGAALVFPGSWWVALRGKGWLSAAIMGCGTIALICIASPSIVERLKQRSTKQICVKVDNSIEDCGRIKVMGIAAESLSYYLNKRVLTVHWKPPAPNTKGIDRLTELVEGDAQTAVFLEKRIVPRMFGKEVDLSTISAEELKKFIPPNLSYVYSDTNVLVVRTRRKTD